ncbi:MAG TPA: chitobiase/beta-hexosaminidase C-terminal domain-containing protein, partial [Nitrospirota bacterium]|nr:chitobiase/beta-hexosaminidase C-terminal domain-containing protein [Nitrospirota bacterium]
TFTVKATDEAGNSTTVIRNIISTQTPITIDPVKTPTNISQQIVTGTRELNSQVTVTCATSVVGTVSYTTPTTWQVIIAGMTESANTIIATATDLEGTTSSSVTATIVLDTHAPVTTPSPAPGLYYNSAVVTLQASEAATIHYTIDGSTPTVSSPVYSGPLPLTSTTRLSFFAIDLAGNQETVKTATYTVTLDTTPPVTTITAGTPNYTSSNGKLYITGSTLFTISATDDVSGIKTTAYHIDGGSWNTYSSPFSLMSEGTHTIGYRSTDNASNTELEKSKSVIVDNTPPASTITVSAPLVTPATPITITATDSASGVKLIEYNIDGSVWSAYTGTFNLSTYSQGTHTITYRSTDNVGNIETPQTRAVQLTSGIPQNFGIFSATSIAMSGGYIDSYDSTQGPYNGTHGSNVAMGTNSKANGAVAMSGGVIDYGSAYVGPGGNPASVIIMSGGSVINGTKAALSALKDMTPKSAPGGGTQITFTNGTTLTSGTYRVSSINLSGTQKGTISGNVTLIVTGSVNLSGSSQIVILPGSSLTIYISGSLNVSGGSIVNQTVNPHNLTISGTSTCTGVNFSGSAALYGSIYTPTANAALSGTMNIYGALIGKSIAISGGAAVHYDSSLGNVGN